MAFGYYEIFPFGYYEIGDYAIHEIDWMSNDVEWEDDEYSELLLSLSPDRENSFGIPQSSPNTTKPRFCRRSEYN